MECDAYNRWCPLKKKIQTVRERERERRERSGRKLAFSNLLKDCTIKQYTLSWVRPWKRKSNYPVSNTSRVKRENWSARRKKTTTTLVERRYCPDSEDQEILLIFGCKSLVLDKVMNNIRTVDSNHNSLGWSFYALVCSVPLVPWQVICLLS